MEYAIGIDLGGTKILTALINKKTGEVIHWIKKKTKKERGAENIVRKMKEAISEILNFAKKDSINVSLIGIGAAGQVDRKNGIILGAPNLDCFNFPIKEILEEEFKIPVYLGNDVEIAALGEMKFGAAKGFCDFICVFVGTGVGSCIVQEGKIRRGASGTAGEIGHIIIDLNGRPCACGAHGCLEAYASRPALERRITGALKKGRTSVITDFMKEGKPISSKMINKSIEQEDELVVQSVSEGSDYLSGGIASAINLINPQLVVLGGGLVDAVDFFYQKTIKKARAKALPVPAETVEFKKALLGDFSGVIGAVFLKEEQSGEL